MLVYENTFISRQGLNGITLGLYYNFYKKCYVADNVD